MKPIRVLTPTLSLLGEIDDYESLIFTRRWHKQGEFQLQINRYKQNVDTLQKDNLVLLGSETQKVGIIKHREIALDENGKQSEVWQIVGQTLSGVTDQRVTMPPAGQSHDAIAGSAETVMKHYVNANIVTPTDANRKIDMLTLATDQARGTTVTWQSRYGSLLHELEKISMASGLGWNISLDLELRKWVFDVYIGRDLTATQVVNPPVIFSTQFESLKSQHFVDSDVNYRNFAIVAGQGEGATRTIQEVGTATGLQRREVFVDARDLATTADLTARGNQVLSEMKTDLLLEGEVLITGPFKYGVDWDLGDIVTIQNKDWGVTLDARITEVKEVYDPGGFRLEVTFGDSFPTLISKVRQELNQMSAEVRR